MHGGLDLIFLHKIFHVSFNVINFIMYFDIFKLQFVYQSLCVFEKSSLPFQQVYFVLNSWHTLYSSLKTCLTTTTTIITSIIVIMTIIMIIIFIVIITTTGTIITRRIKNINILILFIIIIIITFITTSTKPRPQSSIGLASIFTS